MQSPMFVKLSNSTTEINSTGLIGVVANMGMRLLTQVSVTDTCPFLRAY